MAYANRRCACRLTAARRQLSFGCRLAFPSGTLAPVRLRGLRLIVNGLIVGVVLAITAGHYIESLLFGVAPADPWAFGAVVLTLGAVGGIACLLPARRASKIGPMEALRYE